MAEEVLLHEDFLKEEPRENEKLTEDLKPFISANDGAVIAEGEEEDQCPFNNDFEEDVKWEIGITEQVSSITSSFSSPVESDYEEEEERENDSDSDFELDDDENDERESFKPKRKKDTEEEDPPKRYSCRMCNKFYRYKKDLHDHNNRNHGAAKQKDNQFKCPLCPKTYKYVNSVRVHMRTHTNERPFVCSVCKMSFTRNSYLIRHKTLHLKLNQYECLLCNMRFKRRDHTRSHINRFHQLELKKDDISKYISYQQQPNRKNDEKSELNVNSVINRKKPKLNMVGEPCKRKGIPSGFKKLKACSVKLSLIIPRNNRKTESCTGEGVEKTDNKKGIKISTEKVAIQNHDDLKKPLKSTVITSSQKEITLKCVFCSEVFSASSDLVTHYSSHTTLSSCR